MKKYQVIKYTDDFNRNEIGEGKLYYKKDIFTRLKLSIGEIGLLMTLMFEPDNWIFTVEDLQKFTKEPAEEIIEYVNGLIKKGYIVEVEQDV
jgi:hypothetical protein